MKQIIFLTGIHGVGKTTLSFKLRKDIKMKCYSVSSLIRKAGQNIPKDKKTTKNIQSNQGKYKDELKKIKILDDTTLKSNK